MYNNIDLRTKSTFIAGVVAMIVSATLVGVPTAAALDQIHTSVDVPASVDKLWSIVANVGNDPKYWNQIHTVNIISKTGNTVQADTTLGPFNAKGHEIVMLHPKQSVATNITQGPVIGTRLLTLTPLSGNKTRIDVSWSIDMPGIPFFARGFAKDNFIKSTEQALNAIAQAAR